MQNRPKVLGYFSCFLICVAASFPVQIMFLYDHTPLELEAIFSKISLLNWMVIFAALGTAVCVSRASAYTKVMVPISVALVALNNWIVGQMEIDFSPLAASLGTIGFVSAHAVLFQDKIMDLMSNPAKRWWLTPRRHQVQVGVFVSPLNAGAFKSQTFDISENGAFIQTMRSDANSFPKLRSSKLREVDLNDRVTVCLTLGKFRQMRLDARVVRKTDGKGHYPRGIGISFDSLPRGQRKELKKFLESKSRSVLASQMVA